MRMTDGQAPYGVGGGPTGSSDAGASGWVVSGRVTSDMTQTLAGRQVPCCQEATYSACSAVIGSSSMPSAASLRRATSASMASGTT